MKRVIQFLSSILLVVGISAGLASAETTTCTISNTGQGSVNVCSTSTEESVEVTCENNIYVVTDNSQTSSSGGANNSGNTNGGSAITGNATNENNQVVKIGSSCGTAATTTASTTTPTGGKGAGAETPQVTATPVGAVHAGGGAGVKDNTALFVSGIVASVAALAAGGLLGLRKLSFNN